MFWSILAKILHAELEKNRVNLDPKMMQKLAWDLFHLTERLRFLGYDLTKEKDRNKGQYTISEIASRADHKALRNSMEEFDESKFHNALFHLADTRDAIQKLTESMQWWETQLIQASGQDPIDLKR